MHHFTSAVVTGSGSGLGRALALELAKRGAAVVVSDVDVDRMQETVALVEATGGRATGLAADVRDPAALDALREEALDRFGALDLWVNNAGVAGAGAVGEAPLEDWNWVLDIDLRGVVYGCHAAVPHFAEQGRGVVLNVASSAGLIATPGMGPYNVAKAGVVALSETMYCELRNKGVGVTVLCPTFFQTNLLETIRGPAHMAKMGAKLMKASRLDAGDIAATALDAAAAGKLYSVPMWDGYVLWLLRRLGPTAFYSNFTRGVALVERLARR